MATLHRFLRAQTHEIADHVVDELCETNVDSTSLERPNVPPFSASDEELGAVDSVATDGTLPEFLETMSTVVGVASPTPAAMAAFRSVDGVAPLQRDARLAAALLLLWGRPSLRAASRAARGDGTSDDEAKAGGEDAGEGGDSVAVPANGPSSSADASLPSMAKPAPAPTATGAASAAAAEGSAGGSAQAAPVVTDRFGFLPPSDQSLDRGETREERQRRVFLETSRAEKWREMLADWPRWASRRAGKVKTRVRKGVPSCVRGAVWPLLARVPDVRAMVPASPAAYYDEAMQLATAETKPGGVIDRDLDRTFPRSTMFSGKGCEGQQALGFVLKAFAAYRPDINYFQGMNFISAVLLTFMGREDTFYLLTALICNRPYSMGALFSRGRGSIRARNFQLNRLLEAHLPRLSRHLAAQGITTEFFCTEWFITLFSRSFHFEAVLRIWDVFLNEGWKIIFRVALLILKDNESAFLRGDLESIMLAFRVIGERTDPANLVERALALKITTAELQKYEDEWWATAGPGAPEETR